MKLLLGNEALALGARDGGADFYAGYPLQASAEIDLTLLRALPERGGRAVLVEDEAAALAAALGAGAGGSLGVTATSGAGLAAWGPLLAHATEARIPALLAVVGRPADAPARAESASQREFAALKWGASAAEPPVVYAPASAGECYRLARSAAAMAARRREPVILFVDHVVAHLREPVDLAPAPASGAGAPGGPDARGVEEEPAPAELYRARDATVLVVAVGIVARAARTAVRLARDQGVRAGLFRPVRLWPFPDAELRDAAARVRRVVVAELNEGQVADHVTARLIEGDGRLAVRSLREPHAGMVEPARILAALAEGA